MKIDSQNVVVASHEMFEGGTAQAIERYVSTRARSVAVIRLPMAGAPEPRVWKATYQNGVTVTAKRVRSLLRIQSQLLLLMRDQVPLAAFLLRHRQSMDLFIGIDPSTTATGVLLKKMRLINTRIVLYSIDYSPTRFANPHVNRAYHAVERFSTRNADVVWNVSKGISEGRNERDGSIVAKHEALVPVGTDHFVEKPQSVIVERLVFVGHLLEKQGLQHAISSMPAIVERVPALTLTVIGEGPYRPELERLAQELGVSNKIKFLGYVARDEDVYAELDRGGIALATYLDDPQSFTRFADPGKLKLYLATALPILLTDVPPNARELQSRGAAVLVRSNADDICKGALRLLTDSGEFTRASKAALDAGQPWHWTLIFEKAFAELFEQFEGNSRHILSV